LKTGKRQLFLWPNIEADGTFQTGTPGKSPEMAGMNGRSKLLKKYETGKMPKVPWLDKQSLEELGKLSEVWVHWIFFGGGRGEKGAFLGLAHRVFFLGGHLCSKAPLPQHFPAKIRPPSHL